MGVTKIQIFKNRLGNQSFSTRDAVEAGISPRMLSFYVERGEIERVARGVYVFPEFDGEEDFKFQDLALVAKSIKGAVICLISALDYWDITDEIAREYWLAIPNNYPIPTSLEKATFIRPRDLKTGVIERVIAGQKVKITTPERSVCDAFKFLPEETAITALRAYMSQDKEKVKIDELLDTAKVLKSTWVIEIIKEIAEANAKVYPKMDRETFRAYTKWLAKNKGTTR